jgi:hypothetical protein
MTDEIRNSRFKDAVTGEELETALNEKLIRRMNMANLTGEHLKLMTDAELLALQIRKGQILTVNKTFFHIRKEKLDSLRSQIKAKPPYGHSHFGNGSDDAPENPLTHGRWNIK